MSAEFPRALADISSVLRDQAIPPAGPVFAHHFRRPTDTFDFRVCIPLQRALEPHGRVEAVRLPELHVVRTTYHGDYAGLPHAWGEFIAKVQSEAAAMRGDFLEAYVVGPADNADFTTWRTELSIILAETGDQS